MPRNDDDGMIRWDDVNDSGAKRGRVCGELERHVVVVVVVVGVTRGE